MTRLSGTDAPRTGQVKGFSYLRALACLAIIALHTANVAEILYKDEISTAQLTASLGTVYCLMWAVPCFVMVSGALLLDTRRDMPLRRIFTRYIGRILGALVLFGVLFRVFDLAMSGNGMTVTDVLQGFVRVFTGNSWAHLWYLYLLIGLYLLLPFYRMVAANATASQIKYLLLIYFLFLSILPLTRMADISSGFYIHVSTIYPFFFFAGYAIHNGLWRPDRLTAALMAALSTAAIAVLTAVRYRYEAEWLDVLLTNYSSVLVIIQAVGLFTLFSGGASGHVRSREPSDFGRLLLFFDKNSFGIYLIHMVFIRLVLRYMQFDPYPLGQWAFLVLVLGNLVLSCLVTWVLRRIPGLRRLLG